MLAGCASKCHAYFPHGVYNPACPHVSGVDDGCAVLVATGHLGLSTVQSLNVLDPSTSLFTYARQSGQGQYKNALGVASDYPVSFNTPGGTYGIGPWTPTAALVDSRSVGAFNAVNADLAANCRVFNAYQIRCDLPAPTTLTGASISGGVLNTNGTPISLTDGKTHYVYSGVYGSTLRPYPILSGSGSFYSLGPTEVHAPGVSDDPPDTPTQTMYTSTALRISGFNFDDNSLYITGTGYIRVENNRFSEGTNTCYTLVGIGLIQAAAAINSPFLLKSNLFTMNPQCSGSAMLYPGPGGGVTQATFNATITGGTSMVVNSGQSPVLGQYIDFPGNTQQSQIWAVSGSTYSLSNAVTNITNATVTSGPILQRSDTDVISPVGSGAEDIEYNYSDKMAYLDQINNGSSWLAKHNFVEIVAIPNTHNQALVDQPGFYPLVSGASFVASGSGNTLTTSSLIYGTPTAGNATIPWMIATANNGNDQATFQTATILSVSGTGPYTITLDKSEPATSNISFYTGPVYTVPYQVQSDNVFMTNQYASQWTNYGCVAPCTSSTYGQGSGDGIAMFMVNRNEGNTPPKAPGGGKAYGYFTINAYDEMANNVIIGNTSANNTTHTLGVETGSAIRFLNQGQIGGNWGPSTNSGAYSGPVISHNISGNFIDPKGTGACYTIGLGVGVYTGINNGVALALSTDELNSNIDLLDGSQTPASGCNGANTP
jgi:hypothetical protein